MGGGVVSESHYGEEIRPVFGLISCKKLKIGLQPLVYSFHLSICLQVVGHGQSYVMVKKSSKFSGECRGKLRPLVQNYLGV